MIGIVIVAHGGLAQEYLAAVTHVMGQQPGMQAIAIEADHDRETKQLEICEAANNVDKGDGVIIVTDLFGGSPSNLSLKALREAEPPHPVRGKLALAAETLPKVVIWR